VCIPGFPILQGDNDPLRALALRNDSGACGGSVCQPSGTARSLSPEQMACQHLLCSETGVFEEKFPALKNIGRDSTPGLSVFRRI
jgi:hypothetical protein